jgi:hypothetical protein
MQADQSTDEGNMTRRLSRRNFIKASGAALLGAFAPKLAGVRAAGAAQIGPGAGGVGPQEWDFVQPRPVGPPQLGRVTYTSPIREAVGLNQPVVGWIAPETIVTILEEVHGPGPNPHNDLWFRIEGGYLFSSWVQPIKPYVMPETITDPPKWGFWGEIVVPHTWALQQPNGLRVEGEARYYYSTVYHVVDVDADAEGNIWYKIYDEKPPGAYAWVIARHVRPIPPEEFEPIHPDASDKHIIINLAEQLVLCYEGDALVFSTHCSSGSGGWETPAGDHFAMLKQPSRHMYGAENMADPNYFDLPGVPWNIFFVVFGQAIHGTYWHSDYGRPRSHGCVNISSEAAKWMYRWTEPIAPYENDFVQGERESSTPVVVVKG